MVDQINKSNLPKEILSESESWAFIKKEIHENEDYSSDIFSVYGADGNLLAAFDTEEAALAAIIQSGMRHIHLH